MNKVVFWGLTGDKKLMFDNLLEAGSGLYLELNGNKIIMDPGPGTFNGFNQKYPGMIRELDAIILSHVHFDHSTDVNAMIEGMTDGGNMKKGKLIVPSCAYEGDSKVIHNYLKGFPKSTYMVDTTPNIEMENLQIKAVEHQHGIPNYGYKFSFGNSCISIITDTKFFDELLDLYEGSTSMIFNVPYFQIPENKQSKHLCIENVKDMLLKIKPEIAFLTHFGENIYKKGITDVVNFLEKETGVLVRAAKIGKEYKLV